MTPFTFEHTLRAPSVAAVFAAYCDRGHTAEQDRQAEITQRDWLEFLDDADRYRRVSRVVPARQPPALLRSLLSGPLELHETVEWDKRTDTMRVEIRPSVLGGRALIRAAYQLVPGAPGHVLRRYAGEVSVEVRLIGGKVERAIVEDLTRSLEISARCTEAWVARSTGAPPA